MGRLSAILIGACAVIAAQPAHATSEAEGRRRLVPFIRGFTNCIADEIRSRPGLRQRAKDGEWKPVIGAGFEACDAKGVQMMDAHDQLFGRGTGITFLKGSYLQDLPRALQTRLQPDFDRMDAAARAEREAAEEKDRREATALDAKKKLVAEAVAAHENCAVNSLGDLAAHSGESAPILADVVLDRCAPFAEKRISIGIAAFDMTREEAKAIVDRKVAEMRTKMISALVTARAEAAKQRSGEAPTTSSGLPKAQPL